MNKKWMAVFIILAIALFATSWLLPKDTPPPAAPAAPKTGFVSPAPAAQHAGFTAPYGTHRFRALA
ncbi:MAG: hypothetical protein V4864_18180 [Pseudomonadota bacterium]